MEDSGGVVPHGSHAPFGQSQVYAVYFLDREKKEFCLQDSDCSGAPGPCLGQCGPDQVLSYWEENNFCWFFCQLLIWGREDEKHHSLSAWPPTFFKLSLTYSYSFGARVSLLLRGTKGLVVHNLQPRWGSSRWQMVE